MANDMNFCPGCGTPLSPDANFCPNCGRNLKGTTPPSNAPKAPSESSGLKQKLSSIKDSDKLKQTLSTIKDSKVAGAATAVTGKLVTKVKENFGNAKKWDGEVKRSRPLVLPENTPDTILYKGKGYGKFGSKKTSYGFGRIALTKSAIQFYDVPLAKALLPGKHVAKDLVFSINLADIDSFKKETSTLKGTVYSLMVRGGKCTLGFPKECAKFIHYITTLAGLDGNLLNLKLREGEKVIEACDIYAKMNGSVRFWRPCTLYYTNQRMVINKSRAQGKDIIEGAEMFCEKELKDIDRITEERKTLNCVYTITGAGEPIELRFPGVVPPWFLKMVPDGQGNLDLLKRKSKIMKGAKVALLVASVAGVGGDVDADVDVDVDVDADVDADFDADFDVDDGGFDLDGDGIDDGMMLDTDGDGLYDTAVADVDGDGMFDTMAVDADGNGTFDAIGMDTDGNGTIDTIGMDTDGNGAIDTIGMDTDGNGTIDSVYVDTNDSVNAIGMDTDGNGTIDTIGVDTDGDGAIDTIGMDTDGDGAIDTIGVDTDGDGAIDTIGMDTDGNGTIDAIGVDTDGNGTIDTIGVDTDGNGTIDTIGVDTDGNGTIDTIGMDTDGNGTFETVASAIADGGKETDVLRTQQLAAGAAVATGAALESLRSKETVQPKKKKSGKKKKHGNKPKSQEKSSLQEVPIVKEKASKGKTGLILGIIGGVAAIGALVLFLLPKNHAGNNETVAEPALQAEAVTVSGNSSKLAGYEWLEGVWAGRDDYCFGRLVVTDSFIQVVHGNWDSPFKKVENQEKEDYELKVRTNTISGEGDEEMFSLNEMIYVDRNARYVSFIVDEFTSLPLHKIQASSREEALLIANSQYPRRVFSNAYDGFVNIRQAPQGNAPILGTLPNGPEGALYLGEGGEWVHVRDKNGVEGYVYSKYVQDQPTEVFDGARQITMNGALLNRAQNKSYQITMTLGMPDSNGNVRGRYRYLSQPENKTIPLEGKVYQSGDILRYELNSSSGFETFDFKGKKGEMRGTWSLYDNDYDRRNGVNAKSELEVSLAE